LGTVPLGGEGSKAQRVFRGVRSVDPDDPFNTCVCVGGGGSLHVCVWQACLLSKYPSKGPPPRGLSGTEIDGWLGGDVDRPHT
jgi:hypothetical protein